MKNRIFAALLLAFVLIPSFAQNNTKFGYLSFNAVMQLMPEYSKYDTRLILLQESYKAEADRMDREFNRQYAEFLHEQTTMSESILKKRQKELQNLMDESISFKKESQENLNRERDLLLQDLRMKLVDVIQKVAKKQNLDYVVDTDSHTFLYMGSRGVDITHAVFIELGVEKAPVQSSFDNPVIAVQDSLKQIKQ